MTTRTTLLEMIQKTLKDVPNVKQIPMEELDGDTLEGYDFGGVYLYIFEQEYSVGLTEERRTRRAYAVGYDVRTPGSHWEPDCIDYQEHGTYLDLGEAFAEVMFIWFRDRFEAVLECDIEF